MLTPAICIDKATGSLITTDFTIDRDMRRRDLKRIGGKAFEVLHAFEDWVSCRVAAARFEDWLVFVDADLVATELFELRLIARRDGDSWGTFSEAKEEAARRMLVRVTELSGLRDGFRASWGHIEMQFEIHNLYHYLRIAYREHKVTRARPG